MCRTKTIIKHQTRIKLTGPDVPISRNTASVTQIRRVTGTETAMVKLGVKSTPRLACNTQVKWVCSLQAVVKGDCRCSCTPQSPGLPFIGPLYATPPFRQDMERSRYTMRCLCTFQDSRGGQKQGMPAGNLLLWRKLRCVGEICVGWWQKTRFESLTSTFTPLQRRYRKQK